MIGFGIASLVLAIGGHNEVRTQLKQEQIVGSPDMTPEAIAQEAKDAGLPASIELPTCNVADEAIDTGSEAKCFASYMRIHALESTGGLTYAEMGRFQSAANPDDPAGTSDEAAAAKDENGQPISNGARDIWVTETALATALNVSFLAESTALFGVVVAIALILSGIGFIILALGGGIRQGREYAERGCRRRRAKPPQRSSSRRDRARQASPSEAGVKLASSWVTHAQATPRTGIT